MREKTDYLQHKAQSINICIAKLLVFTEKHTGQTTLRTLYAIRMRWAGHVACMGEERGGV
jgi:hypothetical protein